jgi:hypothetical protein
MSRKSSEGRDCVAPTLIAATVYRMIHYGDLASIDYAISGEENTFLLPGNAILTTATIPV